MSKIKFANGDEHSCSFLSTIPHGDKMQAFIALSDVNFVEAATVFSDPRMTSEMEYGVHRLIGYTELISLYVQPYGIQAVMRGGRDEIIEAKEETDDDGSTEAEPDDDPGDAE